MNDEDKRTWYAVHTRSRQEKHLEQQLRQEQGIEAWCPVQRRKQQWADRQKWVDFPLMPGYLFVHIHKAEQIIVLKQTGITGFVPRGKAPTPIPESEISAFRQFIAQYKDIKLIFQPGKAYTLANGPFKGESAIVQQVGKHKVRLLLPALGAILESNMDDLH